MVLARGLLFVPCVRLAWGQGNPGYTIRVIIDGKSFETDETKAMEVGSLLAGIVVVAASPHYPVRLTEALPNLRSAVPLAAKSIWRSPCVRASCRGRGAETRGRGVCTLEITQATRRAPTRKWRARAKAVRPPSPV